LFFAILVLEFYSLWEKYKKDLLLGGKKLSKNMQFNSHFALYFFGQDWFEFWNYPLVSSENKEIKPLKVCINLQIESILKSTTLKPRFVQDHLII
jgi:hypothetical protein